MLALLYKYDCNVQKKPESKMNKLQLQCSRNAIFLMQIFASVNNILLVMYKHRSLLQQQDWQSYDRKQDIGLSTIYQNHAYDQLQRKNGNFRAGSIPSLFKHHRDEHETDSKLEDCEKNLYSLENKAIPAPKQELNERVVINRKMKSRLKVRPNNKTTIESGNMRAKQTNYNKKPIKIDCYQFGQMDKVYKNGLDADDKALQCVSNHLKLSIRERLEQYVSSKKHEADRNSTRYRARRYLTLNPQRKNEFQATKSPLQRIQQHKRPQNNDVSKSNYWDFTVVSLQNVINRRNKEEEMLSPKKESRMSSFRQKILNRQIQQRRKESLYRSNLLQTYQMMPISADKKKEQAKEENQLKQIIRKYFSCKEKQENVQKVLRIQETDRQKGQ